MKKLLIALSSLTTLTITGNSIINNNLSAATNNTRIKTENTNDSPKTSLFNYQYGLLNADPNKPPENTWISNQSSKSKDDKIYSYNLKPVIGITLNDKTKAETAFIVDEDGNLDYNRAIPAIDKPALDDIKTEMIKNQKVTSIKDNYNPYSRSEYVGSGYFADQKGTNTWQYLQQGQAESNIDISQVKNAQNIAHNNAESEALGLYYIAKQYRASENKIDLAVAKEIAEAFIDKSKLAKDLNNDLILIDQIITLMAKNDNVFNFILNTPFYIGPTYKNYAMNYIFDNSNHLIEIYYNHWNNDNYNNTINYHYSKWYNGTSSGDDVLSPVFLIFSNWTSYAANWNDFTSIYPTISFDDNSSISVVCSLYGADKKVGAQLTTNTSKLPLTFRDTFDDIAQECHLYYDGGIFGAYVDLSVQIYIWRDNNNIYLMFNLQEASSDSLEGSNIAVDVSNCTFNNVMN